MSIKILLADDHNIIRTGLMALLERERDLRVVAEVDNGLTALRQARVLKPDVVIMDITMPDLNGVEATRQLLAELPETKVITLSMHSDRRFVLRMLRAGAKGYVLKDSAFEELITAIRSAYANRIFLSASIIDTVARDYIEHSSTPDSPAYSVLTSRERQVLQLLAEGNSTKEIAAQLHVSTKTVETHRRTLMRKLDIHSVAGLTKFAVREGLTSLDN